MRSAKVVVLQTPDGDDIAQVQILLLPSESHPHVVIWRDRVFRMAQSFAYPGQGRLQTYRECFALPAEDLA